MENEFNHSMAELFRNQTQMIIEIEKGLKKMCLACINYSLDNNNREGFMTYGSLYNELENIENQ